MTKDEIVFAEVAALYATANTIMGAWMWRNHTQWVADKARRLAVKYAADPEKSYCAALLHDLGDSMHERGHADFETYTWNQSKVILKKAGFRKAERDKILEAMRTHSCHPGHLPTTLEGKVLATADAMWHLQTNFFAVICFMNRPDGLQNYVEWQKWFAGKIARDYDVKIFFDDERTEVQPDYEALIRVFGNKTFTDK